MSQLRRKIKGIYTGKFEIVCGNNTCPDTDMLAIGEIMSSHSTRWIHLPRSKVKKLIEDYENGERGRDDEEWNTK